MALTITPRTAEVTGQQRITAGGFHFVFAQLTFDNSYPTGGEALGAAELKALGLESYVFAVIPLLNTAGSRLVTYDPATKKLLLFTAVGTEAVNASDQSTISVPVLVIGK